MYHLFEVCLNRVVSPNKILTKKNVSKENGDELWPFEKKECLPLSPVPLVFPLKPFI